MTEADEQSMPEYPRGEERREYPRQYVQIFVEVRPQLDDGQVIALDGVTVNVSRGGMLALLHDLGALEEGSTCEVRFKDPGGVVEPERVSGVVVRSGIRGPDYEVAISFQGPLETLSVPEEVSGP